MDKERFIIHLNVADFAVAVERLSDGRLKNRPVIIAPQGAARAAVYDMSEEAFQSGVRKGMRLSRALRRCRDARVVTSHFHQYESAARDLVKCALPYSPLVEMTDHNGHLFVDVTGTGKLFGPPPDVAWRIRKAMRRYMGVDPIWSVAPNKLIAKVATRLVKPSGEYVVGAGDEARFLAPVPLVLLPGMDRRDLEIFHTLNLTRTGHVAPWSADQLHVIFGHRSGHIHNTVRGIDTTPVLAADRQRPVVRAEHAFGTDTNDPELLLGVLYALAEQAGRDLRQRKLAASTISVSLGYSDGGQAGSQVRTRQRVDSDPDLFELGRQALSKAWTRRVRLRHLQLACSHLVPPPAQMTLFEAPEDTAARSLMRTIDAVREKFGPTALKMGRTLNVPA